MFHHANVIKCLSLRTWTSHICSGVLLDHQGDVRYVAHDTARRGGATDEPLMAVLVHSGVPLGIKLSDEEDCSAQSLPHILYQLTKLTTAIPWSMASRRIFISVFPQ
jgi:hypothetical protein